MEIDLPLDSWGLKRNSQGPNLHLLYFFSQHFPPLEIVMINMMTHYPSLSHYPSGDCRRISQMSHWLFLVPKITLSQAFERTDWHH